jgi:hypothetical protein
VAFKAIYRHREGALRDQTEAALHRGGVEGVWPIARITPLFGWRGRRRSLAAERQPRWHYQERAGASPWRWSEAGRLGTSWQGIRSSPPEIVKSHWPSTCTPTAHSPILVRPTRKKGPPAVPTTRKRRVIAARCPQLVEQ